MTMQRCGKPISKMPKRCLASMEKSVLALEDAPEQREPLKQLCRELHTLKGASGTVGLHPMADYLHHIEDALQACCKSGRCVSRHRDESSNVSMWFAAKCTRCRETAPVGQETRLPTIERAAILANTLAPPSMKWWTAMKKPFA